MPEVSVIVPTYQRRDLVREALKSVSLQTFQNFEAIVVDDGSTDGTEQALTPYRERLTYHRQPNKGVAAARNAALRLARGEVVAFLDSDDLWLPDHLDVVTRVFDLHPKAVLVSTASWFAPDGREDIGATRVEDALPRLLVGNFLGWPSCVAVRRSTLEAVGGFDERLRVGEDLDLWGRLALRGPFAQLFRRTFVRRISDDSLSANARREGLFNQWAQTAASLLDELSARPDPPLDLMDRVRGSVHFVEALRAYDRSDERALRTELAEACRLLPEFGVESQLVMGRLYFATPEDGPNDVLDICSQFATAWPERSSPTSVAIRAHAIRLALGAGELRRATSLAVGMPPSRAAREATLMTRDFFRRRVKASPGEVT